MFNWKIKVPKRKEVVDDLELGVKALERSEEEIKTLFSNAVKETVAKNIQSQVRKSLFALVYGPEALIQTSELEKEKDLLVLGGSINIDTKYPLARYSSRGSSCYVDYEVRQRDLEKYLAEQILEQMIEQGKLDG